jgi:hypothetical protein
MNIAPGLNGLLAQRQFAQQEQQGQLGQIQGLLGIQQAQQQQGLMQKDMEFKGLLGQALQSGDKEGATKILMQYKPELFAQQLAPKPAEPFTLRPGDMRFGADNKPIATAPAIPKEPAKPQIVQLMEQAGIDPASPQGRQMLMGALNKSTSHAPAASVSTTLVNAGPKAFDTELGKMDAEKLGEFRKNAEAGQGMLGTVANLRDAIKKGVYSGGLADQKTAAANLINGITGITPSALPGSQLFTAEASKLVLDSIKLLGANPSNADRDFINKTVPQLATSPQARDALINYLEQKANKNIELFQKADSYARQNKGLGGFNYLGGAAKKITNDAEYNALPSGTEFIGPDGVTRRKP